MTTKSDGKFCYSFIPARFVFVFLGFFGFCLVYSYKVVLSVAIVSMVGHKKILANATQSGCNVSDSAHEDTDIPGDFEHWDDHTQALILGSFFYGYVVTQIPGGVLSERFGAKWIFGGSVLITAIFSLLGPGAAKIHYGLFMATRIGQGLAEGVVFPCMNSMIARWMPKMERSRGTTIIFTGAQIGTVITLPLTGALCDSTFLGGWPSIFYILGATGCVWFALWALLVHENPDKHPYISQEEYDYITSDQGEEKATERPVIPWKAIWTSGPVYALIFTHFGQNWGFLTILTLLPTYFTKVLHLDLKKNGLMSSLPYLCQAIVGWTASLISDKIRQRNIVSVTFIRKTNNTIAYLGPALCMVGVALAKCDSTLSIVFFVMAMGFNGCCYPGFNSTHVDMAPDFAGTLMGITNSIGNIPGFIAPLVAAAFYEKGQTTDNWAWVFYISAGVYVLACVIYDVFASAQLQPWGVGRKSNPSYGNQKNVYSVSNPDNYDDNKDKLY